MLSWSNAGKGVCAWTKSGKRHIGIRYKKNKNDRKVLLAGENENELVQHMVKIEYNPIADSNQIISLLDKPKKISK